MSAFIFNRSHSLLSSSLTSSSSLVRSIFSASSQCVYSFIGYNNTSGKNHFHEMNGDVGMAGWK